ncbi:MAG: hypothetical protein EXS03_06335 [Phycisphaerales bacterium]|nr:hypothetical protein [Phycisphaerales bacterium]
MKSANSLCVRLVVCAVAAISACNSPPTQPAPPQDRTETGDTPQPVSTVGRWSGSFTAQNQASGGQARITIAEDGSVTGSFVDSVWQRAHSVARTGLITGRLTAGVAQVTIAWSTGQSERYEGVASAPSYGSLGINLRLYAPDGNFARSGNLALSLHEQGVVSGPPYGQPPTEPKDFLAQYVGKWTANFHTADGNAGTGSVTIATSGDVRGTLVDDAWSDSSAGSPAQHGSVSGSVNAQGQFVLAWSWSSGGGQTAASIRGHGYFQAPETLIVHLGDSPEAMVLNGPLVTLTLERD